MNKAFSVLTNPKFYKTMWELACVAGKQVRGIWRGFHSNSNPD